MNNIHGYKQSFFVFNGFITKMAESKTQKNAIRYLEKFHDDIAATKFPFKMNYQIFKLPTGDLKSNIKNCLNL